MPNAQCPMPNAQCPMPNAQCPMPNAQCPILQMYYIKFIKKVCFFPIAFSTILPTLLLQQSVTALAKQPACPTGDVTNFPAPPLSQTQKSVPSLWQAQKEFGGKLLDRWFVDSSDTWVVVIVNRQLWSLLDYMERYQFVNRFGTVANEYGYNLRVCNRQGNAVATYVCDRDRLSCQIDLESLSNRGFRGKPKLF
jgi:hypothetical protein